MWGIRVGFFGNSEELEAFYWFKLVCTGYHYCTGTHLNAEIVRSLFARDTTAKLLQPNANNIACAVE